MASVRFSGPNNSTLFTTCCEVAICDDQGECPRCKKEVVPLDKRERWNTAMLQYYGRDRLTKMREAHAREELKVMRQERNKT